MVVAGSWRAPVTDFKCLINFLLWLSPMYAPISAPFRISSPQAAIPLYPSLFTSGDNMGEDLSNILILFPISSIDAFSSSNLRVVYFCLMRPSSSGSGFYILRIFTPAPLDIGFKLLSLLGMSLLFSIMRSAWSLDSSLELPLSDISTALSYRLVSLSVRHYFLQFVLSFFALDFLWIIFPNSIVRHHLIPVKLSSLVTFYSLTLLTIYFLWIRIFISLMRSWASFTVIDECTLLMCKCLTLALAFFLAIMSSL